MGGGSSTPSRRALAVSAGLLADRALPEPPDPFHPVAAFGRTMAVLERAMWRDQRTVGAAFAATGIGVAALAGSRVGSTAVATALCNAGHALGVTAGRVAEALAADDLDRARQRLRALVGRDVAGLGPAGIARAVVESVAENTVDAVVAPAVWAALGGARGAFAYRAVNTLDAMVGHRDPRHARFGWASARADDAANWLPARLTALLVAVVRPRRAREIWAAVRGDAPGHPSPNAGVAEAAFAAALELRLGGPTWYHGRLDGRPLLGRGRDPGPGDIAAAVRLLGDVTLLLGAGLLVAGLAGSARGRRRR